MLHKLAVGSSDDRRLPVFLSPALLFFFITSTTVFFLCSKTQNFPLDQHGNMFGFFFSIYFPGRNSSEHLSVMMFFRVHSCFSLIFQQTYTFLSDGIPSFSSRIFFLSDSYVTHQLQDKESVFHLITRKTVLSLSFVLVSSLFFSRFSFVLFGWILSSTSSLSLSLVENFSSFPFSCYLCVCWEGSRGREILTRQTKTSFSSSNTHVNYLIAFSFLVLLSLSPSCCFVSRSISLFPYVYVVRYDHFHLVRLSIQRQDQQAPSKFTDYITKVSCSCLQIQEEKENMKEYQQNCSPFPSSSDEIIEY